MKRLIFTLFGLLLGAQVWAQDGSDLFTRSGKYYVVVTLLGIIFIGIVVYLIRLDLRIKKLEEKDS